MTHLQNLFTAYMKIKNCSSFNQFLEIVIFLIINRADIQNFTSFNQFLIIVNHLEKNLANAMSNLVWCSTWYFLMLTCFSDVQYIYDILRLANIDHDRTMEVSTDRLQLLNLGRCFNVFIIKWKVTVSFLWFRLFVYLSVNQNRL